MTAVYVIGTGSRSPVPQMLSFREKHQSAQIGPNRSSDMDMDVGTENCHSLGWKACCSIHDCFPEHEPDWSAACVTLILRPPA